MIELSLAKCGNRCFERETNEGRVETVVDPDRSIFFCLLEADVNEPVVVVVVAVVAVVVVVVVD